ncbi:MAG: XDD3 family exosortase-dependent surface protein [Microcoleus sp.]
MISNFTTKINWIYAAIMLLTVAAIPAKKAEAATLHGGWNYAIDSFSDGVTGIHVGGGEFEYYGIAIKETADKAYVAINGNLSLVGYADPLVPAERGNINYGDLFFNFSGTDFNTANTNRSLFAIRFADGNDSRVTTTGVYSGVAARNVTHTNSGFWNLEQYNDVVKANGGTPSMGDLSADDPYFQQTGYWTVLNSIAVGTKVGEIDFLTPENLQVMGLDFAHFNATGSQTIGFRFDKSGMPSGSFIASFFAECANDGIAIKGSFQPKSDPDDVEPVPEPATVLGTLLGLGMLRAGKGRRKIQRKN